MTFTPNPGAPLYEVAEVDTLSENITATYPPLAVPFVMKPTPTILYNLGTDEEPQYQTVKIVDVTKGIPYPPVPGVAKPGMTPLPPQLPRPVVVPVKNTTVFFEDILVTVDGDAVAGPGALPDPRILHGSPLYDNIIIGTNPIVIPFL